MNKKQKVYLSWVVILLTIIGYGWIEIFALPEIHIKWFLLFIWIFVGIILLLVLIWES